MSAGSQHGQLSAVGSLVDLLVRALVDEPERVQITETASGNLVMVEINVAPTDVGKVIGKQGRIIRALRIVARSAAASRDQRVNVEVLS